MWIGTATGLYLLNKNTSQYKYIEIPGESTYINTLYQAPNGLLYVGTSGSGLIIYNPGKNTFKQHLYHTARSERKYHNEYRKRYHLLFQQR